MNFLKKNPKTSIFLLVIIMLTTNIDVLNVTIMEARNFITAREMVQDNHWLLTTLNGEARYQKPPLPTWITAFFGMLFGLKNLIALRFPAIIMVGLLGVFNFKISHFLLNDKESSFINALITVTTFYIIAIIIEAPWDIYAHGFMLTGIYFLLKYLENNSDQWKNILLASIFTGLSILSKGPVSIYALFLPFLISYGIVYQFKNIKSKILPLILFLIVSICIGSWWFVYVRFADPEAFLSITSKEIGNWKNYNVRPFYYYWSFFTQSGIWTIPAFISLLYPYLIKKVSNKKAYRFTFLWTIISVILLSLIQEKKARYLVPVLIPLALNTGVYINYLIKNFNQLTKKTEKIPVYFNFGLIGLIAVLFPIVGYFLLKDTLSEYWVSYSITSVILVGIGVLLFKNLIKQNIKKVVYLTILFFASILMVGLPLTKSLTNNDHFNTINTLPKLEIEKGIKTYSVGTVTPELLWEYGSVLKDIKSTESINLPNENKFGLLISPDKVDLTLNELKTKYNTKHLETYNLNFGKKSKPRLITHLYLVSKK